MHASRHGESVTRGEEKLCSALWLAESLQSRVPPRRLMLSSPLLLQLATAAQSPPPPTAFAPTSGLATPNVQAPVEPLIPGDPGFANNNSAIVLTLPGCSEALGAPTWWLSFATIVWRILPALAGGITLLIASRLMCRCLRRGSTNKHPPYPYPPPYPSPYPPSRAHADGPSRQRRPTFMLSRFSAWMGRGILWSPRPHQSFGSSWDPPLPQSRTSQERANTASDGSSGSHGRAPAHQQQDKCIRV